MKKNLNYLIYLILFSLLGLTDLYGQSTSDSTFYSSFVVSPDSLAKIDHISLTPPDVNKLRAESENSGKDGTFMKVSKILYFNASPETAGDWNKDRTVWKLRISSENAKASALHFNRFQLPEGSSLYVYDVNGEYIDGPYTSKDNPFAKEFTVGIIPKSDIIIEYISPYISKSSDINTPILELSSFSYFYIYPEALEEVLRNYGGSEYCHINVNCPEGENWQVQKKGVAKIYVVSGYEGGFCSGTLINNTANSGEPYFLTAFHCKQGASLSDFNKWVFYFDFETPGCSNPSNQPASKKINGCKEIASADIETSSDMLLLSLNTTIEKIKELGLIYNGWDIAEEPSKSGVGIHHPAGDVKKISTYLNPLVSTSLGPSTPSYFWKVFWSKTQSGHAVTEGGSSGSPLFSDGSGLVVGTLTGGYSSCASPSGYDMYGRIDKHWNSSSDNKKQLKHWLDPDETGKTSCPIFDPNNSNSNTLLVSPKQINFDFEGGQKELKIVSNLSWTATSSHAWLTISNTNGSGNAVLTVSVSANNSENQRAATITILSGEGDEATEKSVSVTQLPKIRSFSFDFESCENFVVDDFSPCTTYDGDEINTYSIKAIDFANETYKGSYIAFNPSLTTPKTIGDNAAAQGQKYGACISVPQGPNNDWFITPKISLEDSPKLSFLAKSWKNEHGLERFKVLVSTTTNEPSSFTNIIPGGNYVEAPISWTEYNYDLSAYKNKAVYVAIQCVSSDAYIFMLDDIKIASNVNQDSFLTLDLENVLFEMSGGTQVVNVDTNVSWEAASNKDWLTISPLTGSGNAKISITASENTQANERSAIVTVVGNNLPEKIINVMQRQSTSILESENADFNIYPNPGAEYFDLSGDMLISRVQMFNLLGVLVYDQEINSDNIRVDVSVLESSQYLIRIFTENGQLLYKKFIKE